MIRGLSGGAEANFMTDPETGEEYLGVSFMAGVATFSGGEVHGGTGYTATFFPLTYLTEYMPF